MYSLAHLMSNTFEKESGRKGGGGGERARGQGVVFKIMYNFA